MPVHLGVIYQSGEKIPFSGTFEVVGVKAAHVVWGHEKAICDLRVGETFAAYEGMEVCWHLVSSSRQQDLEPSTSIM